MAPLGVRVAPGPGLGPHDSGGWEGRTADELLAAMLPAVGGDLAVLVAFGDAQPLGQRVCLCGPAHASALMADG